VKIVVEFSGVILPPNATYARNLDRFPPFLISSNSYKNCYDDLLFFFVRPFHRFLAVLEVVKFMSMTRRNCRPFVLSLFSVHADGIIPRARYSPENKYCSGCNLFRMGCDIITVFEKYSPSETSFVSPSILNRASNRTLFSLVRTKSFCETTDSFP